MRKTMFNSVALYLLSYLGYIIYSSDEIFKLNLSYY